MATVLIVYRMDCNMSGKLVIRAGVILSAIVMTLLSAFSSAEAMPIPVKMAESVAPQVVLPPLEVRAMNVAMTKRGDPYVWGATGPNAFDCSGLIKYSYARVGRWVPRIAQDQRNRSQYISYGSRRPGDLVFFAYGSNVFHVGIYIGVQKWYGQWRSMMIAAAYPGAGVRVEPIYGSWTSGQNITFGRIN